MANFYNNYYRYYNFRNPLNSSQSFQNKDKINYEDSRDISNNNFKQKNSSRSYSFGPAHFKNPFFSGLEEPVFEIFGIKLYLDDIIIIGLLFFLYQENVQDELLYIALILLLIG